MAVIDAALIQRWTLEPPATATGEAFVIISGEDQAIEIPVAGDAAIVLQMGFSVTIPVDADAEVAADTVIAIQPVLVGDAEAAIESTATSLDVNITAAIALAEIAASAVVAIPLTVEAAFGILDYTTTAPAATGSASISLVDNGQGSQPLFPVTFPMNFTDNPLGIQTAEAVITITGTSEDVAAGGVADAVVRIADYGNVFPHTFPIMFEGVNGSTPIFPFVFPGVFTTQANGRLAAAEVAITADAETVAVVIGAATAAIESTAIRVDPTRFPFALPAQFIS
jgi:hypothetical protein